MPATNVTDTITTLTVHSQSHDYPIMIQAGKLAAERAQYHCEHESDSDCEPDYAATVVPYIRGRQVLIVTNVTIAPLYLPQLQAQLHADFDVQVCILPDGEAYKTQDSINQIYDTLMQAHFNRDATLIALGGGVIGDMTGFAAASFMRGVDFIQIPTTLLSQVDSSVGGKTGINHALGKNMIGAFWQPRMVLADMSTLQTLPARELSAGMAEVIKYALIMDEGFLCWLEKHMDAMMGLDLGFLAEAVRRCCEHKAQVVAADEREAGQRALLNFGHTFGHVIETHQGYGNWLHGEAVAAGMVQAAQLSQHLGWIEASAVERIKHILLAANLPICAPAITVATALELMGHDKKVKSGKIRLILLQSIGKAVLTDEFETQALAEVLALTAP